jgi:hypothetical protein
VVAPKDKIEGNALPISQQAYIYRTDLDSEHSVSLTAKNENNGFYIFVVDGSVEIGGSVLNTRDAIGVYETEAVTINAKSNSKLIIIEVPMVF